MPHNNDIIATDKAAWRKSLKTIRKAAHAKHPSAPQDIIRQFHDSPAGSAFDFSGRFVAGYLPIGSELNILPLMADLRACGARILMPAVIGENQPLEFRLWDEDTPLAQEAFGTKAPHSASPVHVPDFICAPLLGFSAEAYRLGYGGGFYDRTLAAIKAQKPILAFGCAYDEQKLDNLPKDSHDLQLNGIITPDRFYRGADY